MTVLSEIKKILKASDYKLASRKHGILLFLREFSSKYAFGFVISKHPKEQFPRISVGVLDHPTENLRSEIEQSQNLGLYGLTFSQELVSDQEAQYNGPDESIMGNAIVEKVQKYINHFESMGSHIIDVIESDMKKGVAPDFYIPKTSQKINEGDFPYRRLVWLITRNLFTSNADIRREIEQIDRSTNNSILKYRLSLLDRFIHGNPPQVS